MSRARNLANLLDANGDVASGALDNVPPSNDAGALTTGTLPIARIADGDITAAKLSGKNAANGPVVLDGDSQLPSVPSYWLKKRPSCEWHITGFSANTIVGNNTVIDENGRRINCQNGNNGPAVAAFIPGVFRGQFEIWYECSHMWGWAGVVAHIASNIDFDTGGRIDAGIQSVFMSINNSSNNKCSAYASGNQILNTSGFSSGLFRFWRNASGQMYFKPPSGTTYTVEAGSNQADLAIVSSIQSSAWVRIVNVIGG